MTISACGAAAAHRHDPESLHDRAESANWINFRDEYLGAKATGTLSDARAARAEPGHHDGLASDQRVGSAQDAVQD